MVVHLKVTQQITLIQCSGTGQVTRKNGVYINSDLINEYQYTVRIRDSYNTKSNKRNYYDSNFR